MNVPTRAVSRRRRPCSSIDVVLVAPEPVLGRRRSREQQPSAGSALQQTSRVMRRCSSRAWARLYKASRVMRRCSARARARAAAQPRTAAERGLGSTRHRAPRADVAPEPVLGRRRSREQQPSVGSALQKTSRVMRRCSARARARAAAQPRTAAEHGLGSTRHRAPRAGVAPEPVLGRRCSREQQPSVGSALQKTSRATRRCSARARARAAAQPRTAAERGLGSTRHHAPRAGVAPEPMLGRRCSREQQPSVGSALQKTSRAMRRCSRKQQPSMGSALHRIRAPSVAGG